MGYIQINLEYIQNHKNISYKPLSLYPSTRRDMALMMPKTQIYQEIAMMIDQYKPSELREYFVFDVFESEEKLGKNNKSMAIAFIYQSDTQTLELDYVNTIHQKLYDTLGQRLSLKLRE